MKKALILFAVLMLCIGSFAATHVLWYNAVTNGYSITDCSPGPCLDASAVVHEGMIMTAMVSAHSGSAEATLVFGSGLDDLQGRCGVIWSLDLDNATGTISSAKVRAEYRDGWAGNAFCNVGPINIRCGVVDFTENLATWGGECYVPNTADWQDFLNPLSSGMGYDFMTQALQAEEIISFQAPEGRPSEFEPSKLDGQFVEVDVTDQVNWILSNSGNHAIVLLVPPSAGNTGKVNTYTQEDGILSATGSDKPWTTDGNTGHIVIESDNFSVSQVCTTAVEKALVPSLVNVTLSQNVPNPFTPTTIFSYNTGNKTGVLKIYDPAGKVVFVKEVAGAGSVSWNAGRFARGIYVYRLTCGNKVVSKKMILI